MMGQHDSTRHHSTSPQSFFAMSTKRLSKGAMGLALRCGGLFKVPLRAAR